MIVVFHSFVVVVVLIVTSYLTQWMSSVYLEIALLSFVQFIISSQFKNVDQRFIYTNMLNSIFIIFIQMLSLDVVFEA
jgi:hypothetical protein